MTVFQGIILGLLQGIAEFLPISSSGHLKLAQRLFDLQEVPLLFDVMLHLATLCSVVLFFRKKLWLLICSFCRIITFRKTDSYDETQLAAEKNNRHYILAIITATVVTGIIGVLTSKLLDDDLISIKVVCCGFIFTAFLLIFSSVIEKNIEKKRNVKSLNDSGSFKAPSVFQSLLIGFAQGVGTLPGVSRSGSTIAGSLFCGVNRELAGEFSFIVSIPAILGAFILELKDLGEVSQIVGIQPLIGGIFAAFASGYLALTWLTRLIKKGRLEWFALYLIPLGVLGLIFF
ncbi:MAG: undecaprenyl-diphosphate phosphatase [Treponema sp.]|nr:undecaprenyl-diphosphate phosphatase [Spirochaetales bacterium]MDY4902397.1 undecaprenyl-diphosphate phosphatase [Treponema sp.]